MSTETAARPRAGTLGARAQGLLGQNGALVALVLLGIILAFLSPVFLSPQNLLNIGVQAAVVAILAFGQTFVIVSAGIDLSVGSVAALGGIVTGYTASTMGVNPVLAIILGVLTGIACGLVSGVLVAYGRLPAFIATLAMLSIARGLALVLSGGVPLNQPPEVAALGQTIGGWLPVPVVIMIVFGLLAAFILNRTYTGRAMYAIGGNEEAARLSGINVRRQQLVIFSLAGLYSAVAGLVLAGRLASGQPQAATGYELDSIAAVVIGGASLAGGQGRAFGTFVGALVLAVIRNGLNLLNVSSFWQQVAIGVVIALAVLSDTLRRRRA
ncbi:ABC transporter permease [Georgenia thermotolerans]|uniref:ABC transporter permease n=1 Tax=Georgenia thermotolerans TaxID=527326 RepID=A0A7J5URG4_9MICO|nr:ABC transporter permease [Georgenia thermotolerans]KAE8765016.1 ABC transporter permease [Georgenia thermotolerans]